MGRLRMLAALVLALVMVLALADNVGRRGFQGRVVAVEGQGVDIAQARLAQDSLNMAVFTQPLMRGQDRGECFLQTRTLSSCRLLVPESALRTPRAELRAQYGGRALTASARSLPVGQEVSMGPVRIWELAPGLMGPSSLTLRLGARSLHFPFDRQLLREALPVLLALLALVCAALLTTRLVAFGEPVASPVSRSWVAPVAAALLTAAALALLELRDPQHFTQNDNYCQFGPKLIWGLRDMWQGRGGFMDRCLDWGTPLFEIGTYALWDPLMQAAWGACGLLGNPGLLLDAYACLSLTLAAAAMAHLAGRCGLSARTALLAGLSWGLAGYFTSTGAVWYYALGIAVWMPTLGLFWVRARVRGLGAQGFAALGLARACFFYTGNIQHFAYGALVEAAAWAWLCRRRRSWPLAAGWAASVALTLALVMPLLLPQALALHSVQRWTETGLASAGIPLEGLLASAFPPPLLHPPFASTVTDDGAAVSAMYHVGWPWMLLAAAGAAAWVRGRTVRAPWLLGLAVALALFSMGRPALLPLLVQFVPVLGRMRFIFKLWPFAVFCLVLWGALALDPLWQARRVAAWVFGLGVVASVLWATVGLGGRIPPLPGPDRAYPALEPAMLAAVSGGRMAVLGPGFPLRRPWASLAPRNLPCVWDLTAVGGAEPLHNSRPWRPGDGENLSVWARRTQVTHVLVMDELLDPPVVLRINDAWDESSRRLAQRFSALPVAARGEGWRLHATGAVAWKVEGREGARAWALPQGSAQARAGVEGPGWVVWPLEYRAGWHADIDGAAAPVLASTEGYCRVGVSAGAHTVRLDYTPPGFTVGLWAGALLGGLSLASLALLGRRSIAG